MRRLDEGYEREYKFAQGQNSHADHMDVIGCEFFAGSQPLERIVDHGFKYIAFGLKFV